MTGTATRFNESGSLVVLIGDKQQAVAPSEIMYLAGDSNYSRLIRRRKSPVMVSITLARYESVLPDFIRIHKRYMVNPAYIKRLIQDGPLRNGATIQLCNGKRLPVSRRRLKITKDKLTNFDKYTVYQ